MEEMILKKENGQVTIINPTNEELKKIKESCHMCSECTNARANRCSKIADIYKKCISAYDYISDGYQIYDENDDTAALIVSKCNNFEKEKETSRTPEQLKRFCELTKGLYAYFYGEEPDENDEDYHADKNYSKVMYSSGLLRNSYESYKTKVKRK